MAHDIEYLLSNHRVERPMLDNFGSIKADELLLWLLLPMKHGEFENIYMVNVLTMHVLTFFTNAIQLIDQIN